MDMVAYRLACSFHWKIHRDCAYFEGHYGEAQGIEGDASCSTNGEDAAATAAGVVISSDEEE
jgi:hypothetical protein